MLDRFGARRWFARIMITWGTITIGMAFIGLLPQPAPLFQALALFGLAAFPVAIAMVVMDAAIPSLSPMLSLISMAFLVAFPYFPSSMSFSSLVSSSTITLT